MTEEQKANMREQLRKQRTEEAQHNAEAMEIDAAISRLADGIVTRAVNTHGAKVPPWADAQARAAAALKEYNDKPLAEAEKLAAALLLVDDSKDERSFAALASPAEGGEEGK